MALATLLGRPPRLVVRTLLATLLAVFVLLAVVATVVALDARQRAQRTVEQSLDTGVQAFRMLDALRLREMRSQAYLSASREELAATVARLGASAVLPQFVTTSATAIGTELHEVANRSRPDVAAIVDTNRRVLGSVGRYAPHWATGTVISLSLPVGDEGDVTRLASDTAFRVLVIPIRHEDAVVGELHIGQALDDGYALSLSAVIRARMGVVVGRRLLAASLVADNRQGLEDLVATTLPGRGTALVGGQEHAVREVLKLGPVRVYAFDSLTEATRAATRDALGAIGFIAIGAFLAGGLASYWLARSLARPIGDLSQALALMAQERRPGRLLARSGKSREVDELTDTFNELFASLEVAEGATQSAYVGAIRGLAAALDARDPYTAGHSERVSALAVAIGRQLRLRRDDLDVLRLGALLHDIGKIGLSDHVLRKPGALTAEEYEAIKAHPRLGARILRSVPFLAPHLPIVELHHERPDGLGYPHGLAGEEIPVPARIVKVADAFDAMTSARAYRPARSASEAIAELWRHSGSQFDTVVVEAFVDAWPKVSPALHRGDERPARPLPVEPEAHITFLGRSSGTALPN
jgi:putative nucleotidyltransferase with HDIG domain